MGLRSMVETTKTVTYSLCAGACVGSLFHGFGHLRRLYSEDYRDRHKEMDLLRHESKDRLTSRLVIGGLIGGAAGVLLGMVLAKGDDDEPDEE